MDIGKLRIDVEKSDKGVWLDFDAETKVLIGRVNSPRYKQVLRENTLPYIEDIRAGTYDTEKQEKVACKTLAEAVLLGWEGLKENGEDVPYSQEKALQYLSDPALDWFRERIEDMGTRMENFYEVAEGNLKK